MRRGVLSLIVGMLLMLILWAPQVRADGVDTFTYTENTVLGPLVLVWQLPDSPTLDAGSFDDSSFTVPSDSGTYTFNGSTVPFTDAFTLVSAGAGGGLHDFFGDSGLYLLTTLGDQLFIGNTNAPTFAKGTYDVVNLVDGFTGTLVISTPEPSLLPMLILGLCGTAILSLRRKVFV